MNEKYVTENSEMIWPKWFGDIEIRARKKMQIRLHMYIVMEIGPQNLDYPKGIETVSHLWQKNGNGVLKVNSSDWESWSQSNFEKEASKNSLLW